MPLISVTTSAPPPPAADQHALLVELSRVVAEGLDKPESYVMTSLQAGVAMTFAGTDEPVCLGDLRSIGTLTAEQTAALSERLCGILASSLGVASDRIYVGFTDVERHLWGWDGRTFAG
jgi:phenylpyruvate tautomerase PptA (4-oxalocrotonate tautomerase family)